MKIIKWWAIDSVPRTESKGEVCRRNWGKQILPCYAQRACCLLWKSSLRVERTMQTKCTTAQSPVGIRRENPFFLVVAACGIGRREGKKSKFVWPLPPVPCIVMHFVCEALLASWRIFQANSRLPEERTERCSANSFHELFCWFQPFIFRHFNHTQNFSAWVFKFFL